MKKLLIAVLMVLGFAQASLAVTNAPLFVQTAYAQTTIGNPVSTYVIRMPQAVLSGNFVYCWEDNNAGTTPSGLADENGTYTLLNSKDTGNSRQHAYYRAATTGARIITVSFTLPTTFVHAGCAEFAHIATTSPLDSGGTGAGVCAGNAVNTALDCTSALNPTQANDLVLYSFQQDDTNATIGGWTAGTNFTLIAADNLDSLGLEYLAQTVQAAITPTVTLSASHSWSGLGSIFKYSAGAGTEPSGMYVTAVANYTQKTGDTGPTVQFPCPISGINELFIAWNGASGRSLTGVSSANTTGTWAQIGTGGTVNGGSGKNQFWNLPNSTCQGTTTVTLTETGGTVLDSNIVILGIVGANTSPVDGSPCNLTGTDSTGAAFSGCSLTSSAAGLMVWYIGANTGLASAIASTSPGLFIGPGTSPVINTSPVGENQGTSVASNAMAASVTITWTPNSVVTGIGAWSDYGIALKAAGGGGGGSTGVCTFSGLLGVATCH